MNQGGDEIASGLVNYLNIKVPLDGIGAPIFYRVDQNQNRYSQTVLEIDDNKIDAMKSASHFLNINISGVELHRTRELKTYQRYVDNGTRLITNLDDAQDNDEYEMYVLNQILSKKYPNGIRLKETDEQFCQKMKNQGVMLYRKQGDIPEGAMYDDCRKYLRAYNRVAKNKSLNKSQNKKPGENIVFIPNKSEFYPQPIFEIIQPQSISPMVGQFINTSYVPENSAFGMLSQSCKRVITPEFELEIIDNEMPHPYSNERSYFINKIWDRIQVAEEEKKSTVLHTSEWEKIHNIYIKISLTSPSIRTPEDDVDYEILGCIYRMTRKNFPVIVIPEKINNESSYI
jgi:hypothetical protein